ncbi:hypothetical protein GC174_18220 [bacterium]|nr:hypothetical protein [bacterium]
MLNWIRQKLNQPNRKAAGGSCKEGDNTMDLGDPQQMIGLSAFTRGGGGGICSQCKQFASVLMDDGKCVKCSQAPIVGKPCPGLCDEKNQP